MKSKFNVPPIVWIVSIILLFPALNIVHSYASQSNTRMSLGENLLIKEKSTPEKENGVELFKKGKYDQAASQFQASLAKDHNDPETLIYLNNSKAERDGFKIAAVVPITSNPNVSQEILRGIAQAQDTINQQGGIHGKKLQVVIANDDNQPKIAEQISTQLVKDKSVIAVVGHNASNASLAAAPIYQKGQLVMITPTSFANSLSGIGNYIFRVVPSTKEMVKPLVNYIVDVTKKDKIAICYDSQAPDNVSFKDEFLANFLSKGGKLVPLVCDLSDHNFNPQLMINQALQQGANGLLMTPHIDRLNQAVALAQANQNQLALFSSPTLYTIKTIELGQQNVKGLVVPIPWHPLVAKNDSFVQTSDRYWGGRVSWRTAMAYDATIAIKAGLQQNPTREGLQNVLHNSHFSALGATGMIKFLPSGDRLAPVYLSQVKPTDNSYNFTLLNKN